MGTFLGIQCRLYREIPGKNSDSVQNSPGSHRVPAGGRHRQAGGGNEAIPSKCRRNVDIGHPGDPSSHDGSQPMDLTEICKALDTDASVAAELANELPSSAPVDWRHLAASLTLRTFAKDTKLNKQLHSEEIEDEFEELGDEFGDRHQSENLVQLGDKHLIGISGGQGAGKSTLASCVVVACEQVGKRALSLSLDDFYLTRDERDDLARRVHPLLATRGVPGTHDVAMCRRTVNELFSAVELRVPRFDKGRDDRCPLEEWDFVRGPFDLVILEGWCVGAPEQPQAQLNEPCNELEAERDQQQIWRGFVNDQLRNTYQDLWQLIDDLIFLAVPNLQAVQRWRGQQEAQRAVGSRMSEREIAEFVAHYERLTCWMLAEMPAIADVVGVLGEAHDLVGLTRRV